jgi:AmiR/NasT family two-component response regulator
MQVVLVANDLAVISRVDAAAARIGAKVSSIASDAAQIAERSKELKADIIVIDLSTSIDVKSLIEQVRVTTTNSPRLVAFGPHVHLERLEAAKEAGCDAVLSRGQFLSQIDAILSVA